ncbi:MAG TPA: hypothetical protein PLI27_10425 [Ignavibacteriales bacterium]|nr:hypothetical protein [Ignavibacteriales bacterium]HOL81969.1 hypothetical protein [Ignavibacteriales bacterium]HOM64987.1 hypothetical protein [Ignavibacteriales bacterium]HPD68477.1 hypothetical protein [Ignavibacteriales bacterium]HPP34106.1 hypothetical protein [Ignavibacteriales bacterium]
MNKIFYKYLNRLVAHIIKYSNAVEKQFTLFIYSLNGEKTIFDHNDEFTKSFYKLHSNIQDMIQTILIRNQLYGRYLRFLNNCSDLLKHLENFSENSIKLIDITSKINFNITFQEFPLLYNHLNKIILYFNELLAALHHQNTQKIVDITLTINNLLNNNKQLVPIMQEKITKSKLYDNIDFIIHDIFSLLEKQILILSQISQIMLFIIEGTLDIKEISVNSPKNSPPSNIIDDLRDQLNIDKKTEELLVEISKIMSEIH